MLKHARLPGPSLTPRACSNSCPSSQWCHPTISCSVAPFSSCLQSFPASGPFPMSQLFTSGGQSIGASASASVLPMVIQDWFSLGLTALISFQSKGLSKVFFSTTIWKHLFFVLKTMPNTSVPSRFTLIPKSSVSSVTVSVTTKLGHRKYSKASCLVHLLVSNIW